MVSFMMEDNGFIYGGRQSYTQVSVNCFCVIIICANYVLIGFKLSHWWKWKLGSVLTLIWKVCLKLPAFWEWNYIDNILMYFSMEKCKPVMYLLIKGKILCEELNLNSWGKRKNNSHTTVIVGHYSCDLNLAMPL